jgi:hypothetical protein
MTVQTITAIGNLISAPASCQDIEGASPPLQAGMAHSAEIKDRSAATPLAGSGHEGLLRIRKGVGKRVRVARGAFREVVPVHYLAYSSG